MYLEENLRFVSWADLYAPKETA